MSSTFQRAVRLVAIFFAMGPQAGHAQTSGERAWMLQVGRDPVAAEQLARSVLHENPGDAIAAHALCLSLGDQERLPEAAEFFEDLMRSAPQRGIGPLGLAEVASRQGATATAESLLTLALDRFTAAGQAEGVLVAEALTAWLVARRGDTPAARPHFEIALAMADSLGRPVMQTWLQLRLGLAYSSTRQSAEAENYNRRALAGAQALQLHNWIGEAHINLSVTARLRMDLDEAMEHRRAALEAYRQAGNLAGQARALHYVATIHLMRGELSRAMRFLREGLAIAEEAGQVREAASCLGDIGALNYQLGNCDLAVQQFDAAIRMVSGDAKETVAVGGDRQWRAWVAGMLSNMGMIRDEQARFDEARDYYHRALTEIRAIGNPGQAARILSNIGRCQCHMGELTRGVATLEAVADSARAWNLTVTEAFAFSELGACHLKRKDPDAAEEALTRATELAHAEGLYTIHKDVLIGRARVARMRGDRTFALALLEEAMAFVEGVRVRSRGAQQIQSGAFAAGSAIYEEALVLIDELQPDQPALASRAFGFAQRAKARAFLDLLAEAGIGLRCRAQPQYVEREQQLLEEIGALLEETTTTEVEMEIARLEDELLMIESQLRTEDPRYADLQYPRPLELPEVQRTLLREGELLLEYLLGEEASFVCVITRDSYQLVRLPARAVIEERVGHLLPLLSDYNLLGSDPTYLRAPLSELSQDLIGPIAEACVQATRLIVAPHGMLHYLPFEILFTRAPPATGGFRELPYLILATDVIYVPTISALAHLRKTEPLAPAGRRLLLIGDPEITGAQEELATIRASLPPEQVDLLSGAAATATNLRAAGRAATYDFVHITAHGILNERRPRFSGLLLTPESEGDDGFFAVGEAFGLELHCRQVVLSACSSALGERVTGEGLVGLTRAFLYAGAGSVVAALWEVSGQATAIFMGTFYGEISDSAAGRAHALAQVKRGFIRGEMTWGDPHDAVAAAHPYFWSPFVLMGEGR